LHFASEFRPLLDGGADTGPIHQGGDAPIGGQPLEVTSTRTVALFSGPVQVGRDGKVRIALDIPDFEGQIRLMAVASGHHAVGSSITFLHSYHLLDVYPGGSFVRFLAAKCCTRPVKQIPALLLCT